MFLLQNTIMDSIVLKEQQYWSFGETITLRSKDTGIEVIGFND